MSRETCGHKIWLQARDDQDRMINVYVRCTKRIGHHQWAGIKRDPIHSFRIEENSQQERL